MSESDIGGILELHKKLATRYKEFETADGETPPVVVLNEMRYALRAAMKLLGQASFSHITSKEEKNTLQVSLQETNHALRNAYHDLIDGILIQISRIMDSLLDKYPVATTKVLGDRRLDILRDINEVEKHIATSRGDGMKRQELYEVEIYEKWFKTIIEHYQFIDQVALIEIIRENSRMVEESNRTAEKEKADNRKFITTITVTVLGILISAVIGIIALG